ncbi:glycosyltransferase family 1 protein, partial [Rhizobium johnstonii]
MSTGLQFGEPIIPSGPFVDLPKVQRISRQASVHVVVDASNRDLLKQGNLLLAPGKVEEAKQCYSRYLGYV